MSHISNEVENIVEKLGYKNSEKLYFNKDIDSCDALSLNDKRVLKEINPCAFFVINDKPKILFFDYHFMADRPQEVYTKIWNFQIPIAIFNDVDKIKVFNGINLKANNIENVQLELLSEIDLDNCNEQSPFSYWDVTSEEFLSQYTTSFSKPTLSENMLANLKWLTQKLKKHKIKFATKLILRIIFCRFLIDRGINIGYKDFNDDIKKNQSYLLEIISNNEELFNLFEYLKEKFNGNLFELDSDSEKALITNEISKLLRDFLSGSIDMKNSQLSLFPLYNFNLIPVELISNIYETLLGTEAQNKGKAFYTPEYLVHYLVRDTIGVTLLTKSECKILDPACGSGVFLVESLRHIVNNHIDDSGYTLDNNKLIELIENNIFGVDINLEAVEVTIFSLYLVLFDYMNPKNLATFKLPILKGKNVFTSDFFDDGNLQDLKSIEFDHIIGNPPWGSIKDGLHVEYCQKEKVPMQNYEISRSFIAKVKEYSTCDTVSTLIVPSKLFYNQQLPAIEYRKKLLNENEILEFIELSSVRKLIFKNANAPAVVLTFKKAENNSLSNVIRHISLKPNLFFKLYQIIAIETNDIKEIRQEIFFDNDWIWKACVYGTLNDIENIMRIKRKEITLLKFINDNDLKTASGITSGDGDKDGTVFAGRYIVDSEKSIDSFYYDHSHKELFNKKKIYRIGKPDVYTPPYCLMRKGINTKNYRIRSAFVEDDVIFEQAISAIKGNESQKGLLKNISGVLNSSLYSYFNLILGASVGTEREQIFQSTLYKYPFIIDEEIGARAFEIQTQNSPSHDIFSQSINKGEISSAIKEFDALVLRKVGLENDLFVDYALNIQIPMLSYKKWVYKRATTDELKRYTQIFKDYWQPLMASEGKYVKIIIYENIKNRFNAVELCIVDEKPENELIIKSDIDNDKLLLSRLMVSKVNEQFYKVKDIAYFSESSFHIIKLNEAKNWHPAMAAIDHTCVLESILINKEEDLGYARIH